MANRNESDERSKASEKVPEPNKPGLMPQEDYVDDRKVNEAEPLQIDQPETRPNSSSEPE